MKSKVVITSPLDEQAIEAIVSQNNSYNPDAMLSLLVRQFIWKNNLRSKLPAPLIRKRLIVYGAFSLILLLDIFEMCFYHRHFFINFLVIAVAAIVLFALLHKSNLQTYLEKEIKTHPDDDMTDILSSQVSGARSAILCRIICFGMIGAVLVFCLIFFSKTKIVYEKNNIGGYSIRYYSISLSGPDDVTLPDTHKGLPVNEIRGYVFKNLKIRNIRLPKQLTEIRGNTFEECSRLERIEIPKGVTRIGGHAFYGCSSLKDVTIPRSVKEIGSSAFRNCTSLKTVLIPRGCSVNEKAFKGSPTKITRY